MWKEKNEIFDGHSGYLIPCHIVKVVIRADINSRANFQIVNTQSDQALFKMFKRQNIIRILTKRS